MKWDNFEFKFHDKFSEGERAAFIYLLKCGIEYQIWQDGTDGEKIIYIIDDCFYRPTRSGWTTMSEMSVTIKTKLPWRNYAFDK